MYYLFFFKAEDAIGCNRGAGVQTCALPIPPPLLLATNAQLWSQASLNNSGGGKALLPPDSTRSGERRVGEECRSRWVADHLKKKNIRQHTYQFILNFDYYRSD